MSTANMVGNRRKRCPALSRITSSVLTTVRRADYSLSRGRSIGIPPSNPALSGRLDLPTTLVDCRAYNLSEGRRAFFLLEG